MNPAELLARRRAPLRLVIFDCDGVLVDSEPVVERIVAAELTRARLADDRRGSEPRASSA